MSFWKTNEWGPRRWPKKRSLCAIFIHYSLRQIYACIPITLSNLPYLLLYCWHLNVIINYSNVHYQQRSPHNARASFRCRQSFGQFRETFQPDIERCSCFRKLWPHAMASPHSGISYPGRWRICVCPMPLANPSDFHLLTPYVSCWFSTKRK